MVFRVSNLSCIFLFEEVNFARLEDHFENAIFKNLIKIIHILIPQFVYVEIL